MILLPKHAFVIDWVRCLTCFPFQVGLLCIKVSRPKPKAQILRKSPFFTKKIEGSGGTGEISKNHTSTIRRRFRFWTNWNFVDRWLEPFKAEAARGGRKRLSNSGWTNYIYRFQKYFTFISLKARWTGFDDIPSEEKLLSWNRQDWDALLYENIDHLKPSNTLSGTDSVSTRLAALTRLPQGHTSVGQQDIPLEILAWE